jgi:lipopolysaccharide transport system ATP-binding protein
VVAGLRRAEARARLRDALEFAELEPFADAPVRTYSDGMKLRLAFGVVAQLRPRVLIVDEVIAVGDLRFQAKCLERIRELRQSGTSVLLASHALDQVASECERALWLQGGEVRMQADAATAVGEYTQAMYSETLARTPAPAAAGSTLELRRNRFGSQELTIERVSVPEEVESGTAFEVSFEVAGRAVTDPIASVTIHRAGDGVVCCDLSTEAAGVRLGQVGSDGLRVTLALERLELAPGDYLVDIGMHEHGWQYAYDFHWQAYPLRVTGRSAGEGLLVPGHRWDAARPVRSAVSGGAGLR